MHDLAKPRPDELDLTSITWAAIISVGLIVVSIAFGVMIDPDVSMFLSP
jgi:hypothetical protein